MIQLDASTLDFSEIEARISELLQEVQDPDSSAQTACDYFGRILSDVLGLLAKDQPWRYWDLDDLCCESIQRRDRVVTMQGSAGWLEGGANCGQFRLDVDLASDPLLYSFKFLDFKTGKQFLYVGKTPDGWIVNG